MLKPAIKRTSDTFPILDDTGLWTLKQLNSDTELGNVVFFKGVWMIWLNM